jgi:hypothetical protein
MEIFEVSPKEYSDIITLPYHIFGSAGFNDLNANKCDEVYYLLFKEGKFRLGIIGGATEKIFCSPFSAPFGGFSYIAKDIRLQYLEDAVKSLKGWAAGKGFSSIRITLPPSLYDSTFIAKQINCLWREGFEISAIELNHSFDLRHLNEKYPENIWYNARKNLRIATNAGLQFIRCSSEDLKRLTYDIIFQNRSYHGKPLRMTWNQVSETACKIPADYFLIETDKQTAIASAIVFHINKNVVQVIYWGDLNGYSEMKPMNFLAFKIFEYYKLSGEEIVDIGYSTENSTPNYGLCEFKESIGCEVNPKYTLKLNLH